MLFQATPIPADWLQFGALGLLALVLVGVGGGAFLLIRAYTDHIKELTKSLSEMGKAMFELSRGLAILNEQSQQLQDAIAKNHDANRARQSVGRQDDNGRSRTQGDDRRAAGVAR